MCNQFFKGLLVGNIALLTVSCVNNLEVSNQENFQGEIPISLSAQILEIKPTRLSDNSFDNSDEMGLFVLAQPNSLQEVRHINNVRLTYQDGNLLPEESIYYPYGNPLCDFISYYPYQEAGVPELSSEIGVSVNYDQSSAENYAKSDFLLAKTDDVEPGRNSVNMQYNHKFTQLNILVRMSGGDDINEVAENTTVSIENIQTKAQYDLTSEQFVSYSDPATVNPNGKWVVNEEDRTITGMKVIVIPQSVADSKVSLQMNGRTFSSSFPESFQLQSGSSYNVIMNFDSKTGIGSMAASLGEWTMGGDVEFDVEEEVNETELNLVSLNFSRYGVYNIQDEKGEVVGTVCQEYLLNDDIDAQAIVLYQASNPLEGTVLQIKGKNEAVHGGRILWNRETNSFTYTSGSRGPVTTLYLDENNSVVTEKPESMQILKAEREVLKDQRGAETNYYAVVKIGCQYFTKENLKTALYNDGTPISDHTGNTTNTTPGYFLNDGDYFYNLGAIKSGKMTPEGWKIPTEQEWLLMKNYIRDNTSVLKTTTEWLASGDVPLGNDLTGFSVYPCGMFYYKKDTGCSFQFLGKYTAFWYGDAEVDVDAWFGVAYDTNIVGKNKGDIYSGFNIRLIKIQ